MEAVVIERTNTAIQAAQRGALANATPADLLQIAIQSNADLDRLERLMDMQLKWEANEAKKAFVAAMSAFKSEPIEIFKRKQVGYTDRKGEFVGYKHAELSDVVGAIAPVMAKHSLSHRWDIHQEPRGITVDCIVTHALGHSEKVTMTAPPDDSGKKNAIQQAASTVTYLERYTLLAATGLSTKSDEDNDGAGQGQAGEGNGALDGSLEDSLTKQALQFTVDSECLAFWRTNAKQFAHDKPAYDRFKNAVAAHRVELGKRAQANKQ